MIFFVSPNVWVVYSSGTRALYDTKLNVHAADNSDWSAKQN